MKIKMWGYKIFSKIYIWFMTLENEIRLMPLTGSDRSVIISLTSYGDRLNSTAYKAICSLLSQSIKPSKIILWVAHGEFIPKKILKLTNYGLEIKYCKDLKSYKKMFPVITEVNNLPLVLADDDIYYPRTWLEKLVSAFESDPLSIHAHRIHSIAVANNKICKYDDWDKCVTLVERENRLFVTTGGGVIFNPSLFNKLFFDSDLFLELSPNADDVWFWVMAIKSNLKIKLVPNCINKVMEIGMQDSGLWMTTNSNCGNDKQILNVITKFPDIESHVIHD